MLTSVPQMPVLSTRMRTSLMPILGSSMSSSQRPGSRRLLTRAFIELYDSVWRGKTGEVRSPGKAAEAYPTRSEASSTFCVDDGVSDSRLRGGGAADRGGGDAGDGPVSHHGRPLGRSGDPREVRSDRGVAGGAARAESPCGWSGGGRRQARGAGGGGGGHVWGAVPSGGSGGPGERQERGARAAARGGD